MLLSLTLVFQTATVFFVSGILYGFSDFILRGLNKIPTKNAAIAMQSINITVYRSLFMTLFILLVLMSLGTAVWSVLLHGWLDSLYVLTGATLYILGMFMITGRGNVPLNEALAKLNADASDTAQSWDNYYLKWTRLNILRCACGVLAGVSWTIAAHQFAI